MRELITWIKQHFTRKFTVPFHILAGLICAFLYPFYPGFSITLFVAFGLFELWQESSEYDEGYLDFWDYLFGAFIGAVILILVRL